MTYPVLFAVAATLVAAASNFAAAQVYEYPGSYSQRGGSVSPAEKATGKSGSPHEASHTIQQRAGQSAAGGWPSKLPPLVDSGKNNNATAGKKNAAGTLSSGQRKKKTGGTMHEDSWETNR